MENNQAAAQPTAPQNAQDGVPSLDDFLGGGNQHVEPATPDLPGSQGQEGTPPTDPTLPIEPGQEPPAPVVPVQPANVAPDDDVVKLLASDNSLLSADDRQFKDAIYDKFQAVGVDFKGNLLNANGEVVLSTDDLNNFIDTGVVPLDENGNQVNSKGEIIVNAADLTDGANLVDLTKTFLETELGYQLLDEEGKPRSYPNTVEGNQQFAKDAVIAAQTSAVSSFFGGNPEVRDLFFHLQAGGTVENFVDKAVDYTSLDVNSLSKEQKLQYIKDSYVRQGIKNPDNIMSLIEAAGDERITKESADALLALREVSEREKEQDRINYENQVQANQVATEQYWSKVKSMIDTGSLKNINISPADKDAFYRYIAEPINNNGDTREMLDSRKETEEEQLLISYLRYKGGDVSILVKAKSQLNRIEALKQRMGNNIPIPAINGSRERSAATNNSATYVPSIETLLG